MNLQHPSVNKIIRVKSDFPTSSVKHAALLQYSTCSDRYVRIGAKSSCLHYSDAIMTTMASQITSITIVYSTVYSGVDQIKHQIKHFRVTGLCEGNSPVTGDFPAQRAGNAENVSILWRHHIKIFLWEAGTWTAWYNGLHLEKRCWHLAVTYLMKSYHISSRIWYMILPPVMPIICPELTFENFQSRILTSSMTTIEFGRQMRYRMILETEI